MGEKRKYPRFETALPVEWVKKNKVLGKAQMVDISRKGFRLLSNFPIKPGNRMNFRIHVPERGSTFLLKGKNIWNRFCDSQREAGFVFKRIRSSSKSLLLDYAYERWLKKVRD